jgi:cyclic GMP-AMP synthase DncV-like protein/ribonuclease P/MRP subunit Pop3-like protein
VDTMEQMLSMLLGGAVETLDISPDLQQVAIERYEEVGTWLAEHGGYRCRIYPQGSFRLGTVVRPGSSTGEFDIDLVCWLLIAKDNITQAELKQRAGDLLHAYMRWKKRHDHTDGPKTCEARRRCWTLAYPDHGFHLDVLPTIPDVEHPPTGILLTDKQLYRWQHSNPIGYAAWFRSRSEELQLRLTEAALRKHVNVADVPEWEVRTTLQRIVQVLKWHCMLRFACDPDNRPPSILITTLAARAYRGEVDLFTAARNALAGMEDHIENRHGTWWIPNPAHEEENFADKWNDYPERREAFIAWHRDITSVLDDLVQLQGKGLQAVASRMSESFDPDVVKLSAQRYGDRLRQHTEAGTLRMTRTGLLTTTAVGAPVRRHTFYGEHTNPRD